MRDKFKTIEVSFDELDNIIIDDDETKFLIVSKDNVKFEFLLRKKHTSKKLIIFGSGAYDNKKISLPVFQRYTWKDEFEENLIFFNDPTLYLGDITLAWGYGTKDHYYLETIANILKKIIKVMNIRNENIGIYGSSGGGFMAIILATFIRGSKAIVNNPQTNIGKYYEGLTKKMFSLIYPDMELQKALECYPERVNIIELFKRENYVPNITYLQNIACKFDMDNQFLPMIQGLRMINESYFYSKIDIRLYSNKAENHSPLSKAKTILLIKEVLGINTRYKNILEIKSNNWREFSKRNGYSLFRYEVKVDRNIIGKEFIIKVNDKEIKKMGVKNIDSEGYGDIYINEHLYISVAHKDISEDGNINEENIIKYFSSKTITIYY
ncbi:MULTISPECIES: glycosyl transferase family 2 [Clostridium]|jgi:hypothetical protein|uniref:Uncharacterized protein n=1 Tax=Clostridium tertium TaxID=1559 RepID=A0A9X3XIT9_9CLOT|nr:MULTISPECIES: glycosyl transferase family 2 [Clostridium]MDC4240150.1 hypothetical protein [Clostridium tertium]MDU2460618.1 hypothetical protein [Clostridium sp.]MDU7363205.1 hypothetical protein [Clostridium sp.]